MQSDWERFKELFVTTNRTRFHWEIRCRYDNGSKLIVRHDRRNITNYEVITNDQPVILPENAMFDYVRQFILQNRHLGALRMESSELEEGMRGVPITVDDSNNEIWNAHVASITSGFNRDATRHYHLDDVAYGDDPITDRTTRTNTYLQENVIPNRSVYILPNRRGNGSVDALYTFNENGIGGVLQQANPTSPIQKHAFGFANLRRPRSGP